MAVKWIKKILLFHDQKQTKSNGSKYASRQVVPFHETEKEKSLVIIVKTRESEVIGFSGGDLHQ